LPQRTIGSGRVETDYKIPKNTKPQSAAPDATVTDPPHSRAGAVAVDMIVKFLDAQRGCYRRST